MKLPPELEPSDNGDLVLNAADVEELGRRIKGLIAQRDHARAWAAYHHADAAQERRRLGLLVKFHRISQDRVPHQVGAELPWPPESLTRTASDGWSGVVPGMLPKAESTP